MAAPAAAPAPAAALSQEEQFYAGLGGRCRRGFFRDVAWDEACLATAIDAFRVPDRRCYVPDDCGPYEHRCPTIGSNCQSTVTMSKPVVHVFCLHALATLIRRGAPSDGRFRVLDVGSGTGFLTAALAALLDNEGVRGDVLGIDVEETLVRLGRENYAADGLDLPVKFRREDAWQAPKKKGEFLFICVGACAQHVPAALCDRLAPGGLLVVPVVATGTRRQAYLMVRRDLRGRLLAPRTVCEASFVPLIDTRDFAPETRALLTGGCSDDEGDPLIYVKGDVGGRGGGGAAFYGSQQGVIDESGFGVSMEPGVVFGSVNAPVPLGPYVAPPPTFTEPDKAVTRRMEFLSRRLDRMRAAPGIFEPGVSQYEPGYEPVEET